jgi:hypothetical protein
MAFYQPRREQKDAGGLKTPGNRYQTVPSLRIWKVPAIFTEGDNISVLPVFTILQATRRKHN